MTRSVTVPACAWVVAILAAVTGMLLPSTQEPASYALFAFAVALSALVALLLIADGLRERRARRRAIAEASHASLGRLEYLPTVTTATRRIRWHGGPSRVRREGPETSSTGPTALVFDPEPSASHGEELAGSASRMTGAG